MTGGVFSARAGLGIGMAALAELLQRDLFAQVPSRIPDPGSRARERSRSSAFRAEGQAGDLPVPDRGAVATRSVRLQAAARQGASTDLPESIRMGQRLTGMSATQSTFPVVQSIFKFEQHGE